MCLALRPVHCKVLAVTRPTQGVGPPHCSKGSSASPGGPWSWLAAPDPASLLPGVRGWVPVFCSCNNVSSELWAEAAKQPCRRAGPFQEEGWLAEGMHRLCGQTCPGTLRDIPGLTSTTREGQGWLQAFPTGAGGRVRVTDSGTLHFYLCS